VNSAKVANRDRRLAKSRKAAKPVLLSGGQSPDREGLMATQPCRSYIAAIPGWKSTSGRRLDALITRTVPGGASPLNNPPLYGVEGAAGSSASMLFTKYVEGGLLPRRGRCVLSQPGKSKQKEVRYLGHP
jgi:hypothetical protein